MSASINVDLKTTGNIPAELRSFASQIEVLADQLLSCGGNIEKYLHNAAASSMRDAARSASEQLLLRAASMNSLSEALALIISEYGKTENSNTELLLGALAEEAADTAPGTDKRSGWRKFWDYVFRRNVDTQFTHTNDEQEKAADERMKADIAALLASNPKYSESNWKNASVDERKQILNDLLVDVQRLMGMNVVNGGIHWTNTGPSSDGTINMGAYQDGTRSVRINQYILENYSAAESYHLTTTIVHELRHAYQHEAIRHPDQFQVTRETIDAWKESFRTYAREQAKGYEAYRNIIVERDARSFAGQD